MDQATAGKTHHKFLQPCSNRRNPINKGCKGKVQMKHHLKTSYLLQDNLYLLPQITKLKEEFKTPSNQTLQD